MKTLTINTVTVAGTDVTIAGTLSDVTYTQPAQQVTIADRPAGNTVWTRAIQMTDEALMCKRYGSTPFAMGVTSFAMLAFTVEPDLTWPIEITTQPVGVPTFVHGGGNHADYTVVVTTNEVATTYTWQVSATSNFASPTTITTGGVYSVAVPGTLTITPADASLNGKFYRCLVHNAQGADLTSDSVVLLVT